MSLDQTAAHPGLGPGTVGVLHAQLEDVRHLGILRGGGIGDLLLALPAIEALAAAYPRARVTLLGTRVHRALLTGRCDAVDAVAVLPSAAPLGRAAEDGDPVGAVEVEAYVASMRARRLDLAVQLHGGGRFSNPFLLRLGARHSVGSATPDAERLERTLPYEYFQHEVARGLEVAALAGARPVTLEPRLRATARDLRRAQERLGDRGVPVLAVHPGATDPRRRWPAERFAAVVAAAVLETGARVVVVGDAHDRGLTGAVGEMARASLPTSLHDHVVDLGGAADLATLVGVLALADVLVGNDSGPRHLAQALGCATVGIYWAGNVISAGPASRARHRVHVSWTCTCPECGVDVTQVGWTAPRCAHDPSFVRDVGTAGVRDDVLELTATTPPPRGR